MKLKTLIQAGCSLLAFIFIFLPWYTYSVSFLGYASSASANSFAETALGVLSLLAALAALTWFVLEILNQLSILKLKIPAKTKKIVDICAGGLIALFGVIGFIIALVNGSEIIPVHPGVGIYFYILAGAAILVLTFIKLDQTVGQAPKKAEKKEDKKDEKKD